MLLIPTLANHHLHALLRHPPPKLTTHDGLKQPLMHKLAIRDSSKLMHPHAPRSLTQPLRTHSPQFTHHPFLHTYSQEPANLRELFLPLHQILRLHPTPIRPHHRPLHDPLLPRQHEQLIRQLVKHRVRPRAITRDCDLTWITPKLTNAPVRPLQRQPLVPQPKVPRGITPLIPS